MTDDGAFASFLGGGYDPDLAHANIEAIRDLDGDGLSDLGTAMIVDLGGGEQLGALVLPSGSYAGLNQPLPDRTLVLGGGEDESVAHVAPSAGDFDGDGERGEPEIDWGLPA